MRKWFKRILTRIKKLFRKFKKVDLALLREFIYLDEVSVISLSSSLRGALTDQITDSETSSLKNEGKADIGLTSLPLKPKVGFRAELSKSESRQILRKSTIQSTYRDLINDLGNRLIIYHGEESIMFPSKKEDIAASIKGWSRDDEIKWIVPGSDLRRGSLVEFEVELRADIVYGAGLTLSVVTDMLKELNNLSQMPLDEKVLNQLLSLSNVLTQLLIGLIPIKSRVVGWQVVEHGGRVFLVTDAAASRLEGKRGFTTAPLFITGVLEEGMFWKDVRQVLFNNYHMKMLCRVKGPISKDWNPIKMLDIVSSILPSMADDMSLINSEDWWRNLGNANDGERYVGRLNELKLDARAISKSYIEIVLQEEGIALDMATKARIDMVADGYEGDGSYRSIVDLLRKVGQAIEEIADVVIEKEKLPSYRRLAIEQAGQPPAAIDFVENFRKFKDNDYCLDTEVISIYW